MNYLQQISDIYNEFDITPTDQEILNVYDHFKNHDNPTNKIKTYILKQNICKLLTKQSISDPIKFLRDKKIMTCLSSERFGTNGTDFAGALKDKIYLSVNKQWTKDLDKNNILIVYSIPDKNYFVITSRKLKQVNKIDYKYSYFIDIKEFMNIYDVNDIYNTIHSIVN